MKPVTCHFILSFFLIYIGLGTAVSAATTEPLGSRYDVRYQTEFGTVDVGTSEANWHIKEQQFSMTGAFKSAGIATLFADFEGYVNIRAIRLGEQWQGQKMGIASAYKSKANIAETAWSEDGKIATAKTDPPPDLDEVYPINAAMLRDVTDPFSAMMTMLDRLKAGHPCEGSFQIFDGRRRAELTFSDLGTETLEPDRNFAFGGHTRVCGIESNPIGGHRRKSRLNQQTDKPPKTRAYVAELAKDVLVPVRIENDLFFGRLVTRLNMDQSSF